jgi:hypothetical protein
MPNPLFKPPSHLVKEWPEVFEGLYMNTMPIAYIEYVHLEFNSGMVWQIDIKEQLKAQPAQAVADRLLETLQEYKNEIKKLDFKIDISQLKTDIDKETKKLF